VFTSTPSTLAHQGVAYQYDADGIVDVSGGSGVTFSATTAPAGFTVGAATGLVAWTPAPRGNVDVVLHALNAFGAADQQFTVSVLPTATGAAPVIVHAANPSAAVGVAYVYDADGRVDVGGDAPLTFTFVSGPAGFHVDNETGLVAWIPAVDGVATVALRADNEFGSDTYTFDVDVAAVAGSAPAPVARLTPSDGSAPLSVAADGSQSAAAIGSSIAFYAWSFGDGTPPESGVTTTHVYARAGGFVAHLRVADTDGVSADASAVVRVSDGAVVPPSARILVSSVTGADSLDVSFSCDCSDGDAPIEAFQWDFGDGELSDKNAISHIFGAGGFDVRLTVVDGNGLTAQDVVSVRVTGAGNQPPALAASAQPAFGNAPFTTTFVSAAGDPDGTIASLSWSFGDGGESDLAEPQYTYAVPGSYTAVVTATDDRGLTTTASVLVDVSDAQGVRPPQILSLPITDAKVGVVYSYDADGLPAARGDRPLTWTLGKDVGGTQVGAPDGMSVDGLTGRILWTPVAAQAERSR